MLGAHRQLLYLHIIEHQDPLDELHQFEFTPISEIEEIPEYEIETPGHTIHADGQMPTLPMETLASDLRTTYVVTNVAQYDEIPPPNTLEAQPEETAEPIATLEMLPQDNLEDPDHPLDRKGQVPSLRPVTLNPKSLAEVKVSPSGTLAWIRRRLKQKNCKAVARDLECFQRRPRSPNKNVPHAHHYRHLIAWCRQGWEQRVTRPRGWQTRLQRKGGLAGIAHK
ncbi:hypothetical protein JB92DRAFT_3097003 [Gautieria morchelliformis]|nr:hypothetical protein JB92DRAFT_3097003 [Gautieria morchelliformis]